MAEKPIKDENPDFYDSDVGRSKMYWSAGSLGNAFFAVRKFDLTEEIIAKAKEVIDSDKDTISEYWKEKYISESVKSWDKFYKRNNVNFFLDRHWIDKEFNELISDDKSMPGSRGPPLLIEFGCGVGNSLIPLLQISKDLHCIGFDCSSRAVSLLQERWSEVLSRSKEAESQGTDAGCTLSREEGTDTGCPFNSLQGSDKHCTRLRGFVFDIVNSDIPTHICPNESADFGLLIFVLSAIHPKHHQDVITRCSKSLKSGAILLFRDYGRYDMAQIRFAKSSKSKITDNFYVRYDGTFAYYFTTQELQTLFEKAGFKTISNNYCLREVVNRKTQVTMQRVWIQAKFAKI
ncbi:methylase [Cryptosporidium canis]|uniref:tRNA N(3)-methylcytidine methyltransferase n=1 Tax=Cryptosporidium canis TaxID=195482 RepID=A0ABQ8P8K5_9CRYT|nr:methylase [Cryptosporidium canis]KAJ1612535.1 methylase [Cryptosporidium canis]